jgi:hypothetical protein
MTARRRLASHPLRRFPLLPAVIALGTFWPATGGAQTTRGPVVLNRVAAKVQATDLQTLSRRDPVALWREGQPVRVIEDLRGKENAVGGPEGGAQPPRRGPQVAARDVRSMPPARIWQAGQPVRVMQDLREDRTAPGGGAAPEAGAPDPGLAPQPGVAFDGIPATGSLPPDTVGDVGPKHYVQMVNTAFAIYDKAGALLAGPVAINSLWAGFGGPCETTNNGDPVVRYDHLADRWVLSQFALPANNFRQCFAVSRTPDPVAGGWFLYDFPMVDAAGQPVFPDYPKIGVWPDAYYMGTQRGFPNGGLDVWAFERTRMIAGQPAAAIQFAVAAPSLFLMPADLDGPPPPNGSPGVFARQVDGDRFGGVDRVELFAFTANWANPAASTFVANGSLPTAAFDSVLCSATLLGACIPQPGTAQRLETLTVWPMWRAQYRNFGDHESLVFNHTVDADGQDLAGVRWYELRRQGGGAWSIFQQGTHAAPRLHRWMASVAMDGSGDLAAGFSVSSADVSPGLRAATRRPTDPPGTLPDEIVLAAGAGSQTHASSRWGNYSSLDVDPVDDCTFWYAAEYYIATSAAGWRTRVSSFRLPECGRGGGGREGSQFAAKIVCGLQKDPEDMRLARGFYATTINIHNPQEKDVTFKKKLALSFPPKEQRPGKVMPIAEDTLRPDEALKVDCMDVRGRLFPNGFPTPYIEGFIVIDSPASLDVTAVYTTTALDREGRPGDHSSIDVEQIRERRTAGGTPPPTDGCPDLVVSAIGTPSVNCPGGGGTCVTTVQYTIANTGTAPAGPFSARAVLDPAQSVVIDQLFPTGLAPGASQSVPVVTPPGGNCFDPDCTVCVTVDPKQEVKECKEDNNKLCGGTIG